MRVAVLGSGPAGLLAAETALDQHHDAVVDVFTNNQQTSYAVPGSAVSAAEPEFREFLQEHLGMEPAESILPYSRKLRGTAEQYSRKTLTLPSTKLGKSISVMRNRFNEGVPLHLLNTVLHDRWVGKMKHWDARMDDLPRGYDITISTIPRFLLCSDERHDFVKQHTYIVDYAKGKSFIDTHPTDAPFGVVYSGDPDDFWVYSGMDASGEATEFTEYQPDWDCIPTRRPIKTNCTCESEVVKAGTLGRWSPAVGVLDAYIQTIKAVDIFDAATHSE